MQTVSEVMTRNVRFVSPRENLQRAAQMMDELNVGALPVCDGERLVGMVTDRDITVRATAAGKAPAEARVEEVMSADVRWCFEDQPLDEVMQQMADTQIRRVPVVSHDDAHKLVGIVAIGDLATKTSGNVQKQDVEQALEKVSSPSEPDRKPQAGSASATIAATTTGADRAGASGSTGSHPGTAAGFAGTDTMDVAAGDDIDAAAGLGATDDEAIASTAREAGTMRATPAEGTAGNTGNTGSTGAPGGTDAAGATGSSGGAAGGAGSAGTGVGAKP